MTTAVEKLQATVAKVGQVAAATREAAAQAGRTAGEAQQQEAPTAGAVSGAPGSGR